MADLGSVGTSYAGDYKHPILTVNVAPGEFTHVVAGIVYDDTSTPTARTVRLHRRSDGLLLSEGTSDAGDGTYSLDATSAEVYRVVLDDDAGTLYNDIIDRVLPGLADVIAATGMAVETDTALAL